MLALFSMSVQYFVLKRFSEFVMDAPAEKGLRSVLTKLLNLFAVTCLDQYTDVLYQGDGRAHHERGDLYEACVHSTVTVCPILQQLGGQLDRLGLNSIFMISYLLRPCQEGTFLVPSVPRSSRTASWIIALRYVGH